MAFQWSLVPTYLPRHSIIHKCPLYHSLPKILACLTFQLTTLSTGHLHLPESIHLISLCFYHLVFKCVIQEKRLYSLDRSFHSTKQPREAEMTIRTQQQDLRSKSQSNAKGLQIQFITDGYLNFFNVANTFSLLTRSSSSCSFRAISASDNSCSLRGLS